MTFTPQWDNTYARLTSLFHAPFSPTLSHTTPTLLWLNAPLAKTMNVPTTWIQSPEGLKAFSGLSIERDNQGTPSVAMAYAGHQFGGWAPRLGDGRAVLLGEWLADGERYDIHLKGSGRTDFSRRGDGQATLTSVLREVLISEALFALGIPTTRSLVAISTGKHIMRDSGRVKSAVLTRVGQSHLRVGSFEYASSMEVRNSATPSKPPYVQELANYIINRHAPHLKEETFPYRALLKWIILRQSSLIASWMNMGFIHGVMNTDNMGIVGDTLDFGPCAFMDTYHPDTVFSAIDMHGRYAYGNQPFMAHWNLSRLAETLLPFLSLRSITIHSQSLTAKDNLAVAQEALDEFMPQYRLAWQQGMTKKLGLMTFDHAEPSPISQNLASLSEDWLNLLADNRADFTCSWSALTLLMQSLIASSPADFSEVITRAEPLFHPLITNKTSLEAWLQRWYLMQTIILTTPETKISALQHMQNTNPMVIPRNYWVEDALHAAEAGDLQPFNTLLAEVSDPFRPRAESHRYCVPPPTMPHYQTFCGT